MTFDLRLPLGLIFTLFGGMLVIYGLIAGPSQATAVDINVNAIWGGVVLAFGLWMLTLAILARRRRKDRAP